MKPKQSVYKNPIGKKLQILVNKLKFWTKTEIQAKLLTCILFMFQPFVSRKKICPKNGVNS